MAQVFLSYARENKPAVEELADHLTILGHQTWMDSSLRGGDDWWKEILRRIAAADVFIAIISREALNSDACRREFDWAEALAKPVLPVAVEPPPSALPRRFSVRQIVDYSTTDQQAVLRLAGALSAVPPAPPLPDPLPDAPAAPLSYMTDLIDQVVRSEPLDHETQWQIISHLEAALRSVDPEERRGGHDVLNRLKSRRDLYADVDRALSQLDTGDVVPHMEETTKAAIDAGITRTTAPRPVIRPIRRTTSEPEPTDEHETDNGLAPSGGTRAERQQPTRHGAIGLLAMAFAVMSFLIAIASTLDVSWHLGLYSLDGLNYLFAGGVSYEYDPAYDRFPAAAVVLWILPCLAFALLARALARVQGPAVALSAWSASASAAIIVLLSLFYPGLSRYLALAIVIVFFCALVVFGISARTITGAAAAVCIIAAGLIGLLSAFGKWSYPGDIYDGMANLFQGIAVAWLLAFFIFGLLIWRSKSSIVAAS